MEKQTIATHSSSSEPGTHPPAKRPKSALDQCAPLTSDEATQDQSASPEIRRPGRDEPFIRTGEPREYACIVDKHHDEYGSYRGEDYYPVTAEIQQQAMVNVRRVRFHPCVASTGERFILPQKMDLPGALPNSWNASLAEALQQSEGLWSTTWSDSTAQRYCYEICDPQPGDSGSYPGFDDDLTGLLSGNIIDSPDHRLVRAQSRPEEPAFDEWGDDL